MIEQLKKIGESYNFSIKDIITILQFSLILDKEKNLKPKYLDCDLFAEFEKLPNKELLLKVYNNRNKKRLRY